MAVSVATEKKGGLRTHSIERAKGKATNGVTHIVARDLLLACFLPGRSFIVGLDYLVSELLERLSSAGAGGCALCSKGIHAKKVLGENRFCFETNQCCHRKGRLRGSASTCHLLVLAGECAGSMEPVSERSIIRSVSSGITVDGMTKDSPGLKSGKGRILEGNWNKLGQQIHGLTGGNDLNAIIVQVIRVCCRSGCIQHGIKHVKSQNSNLAGLSKEICGCQDHIWRQAFRSITLEHEVRWVTVAAYGQLDAKWRMY